MIRKKCVSDADFKQCIIFWRKVEVWIDGELETVGKIEKFTADSVKISIIKPRTNRPTTA